MFCVQIKFLAYRGLVRLILYVFRNIFCLSEVAERCIAAAERNTTIKWESAGATAERCSANDATEDWQNVFSAAAEQMGKSGGATAERRMQYEMCAELIH